MDATLNTLRSPRVPHALHVQIDEVTTGQQATADRERDKAEEEERPDTHAFRISERDDQ